MLYYDRIDVSEGTEVNKEGRLRNVLFVTNDIF